MITWTSAGAVPRPSMLQIRVQRRYPDRIRAGAPQPQRSLSLAELRANLRFFTEEMRGPRSKPCTSLVLSGAGVLEREELGELLLQARQWGVEHIVLHGSLQDLEAPLALARHLDRLVLPVGGEPQRWAEARDRCAAAALPLSGTLSLSAATLALPAAALDALVSHPPPSLTLSYPFPQPGAEAPPPLARVLPWLRELRLRLGPAQALSIKGLPHCYLEELGALAHRSANRWYVDAAHQREQAVLFFPEVVNFAKWERCRFCAADARCDGFFEQWLRLGGFPELEPL